MIHTSILQSSLSPTQERIERPLKGGKLYESITNLECNTFPVIISYWLTSTEAFDYEYKVIGDHGISESILKEILEELIQKAI